MNYKCPFSVCVVIGVTGVIGVIDVTGVTGVIDVEKAHTDHNNDDPT